MRMTTTGLLLATGVIVFVICAAATPTHGWISSDDDPKIEELAKWAVAEMKQGLQLINVVRCEEQDQGGPGIIYRILLDAVHRTGGMGHFTADVYEDAATKVRALLYFGTAR
ncbi:putative cysteine proteinase inhibitor 7 [Triticum dicoccoides]|uniref:putative cysteine proteinase inhibitor 7 n=1 Tax=Triticum dicoccoides TaxID=85692 RepID=UPI001233B5F7|nr:putative cysteine proteinase inhibitor 7 [Triticum dicoccoides]XP_037470315.1 putative cysteine proteinase inhibitor 7 [Triticum dicoccoides]